jgi:release factor glutamine methyltransferase
MKLSEADARLRAAGIEDHIREARLIFSEIGGFDAVTLTLDDVESCSERLLDAVNRRCKREPLQYILGYTYFYNEKYYVDGSVLIPRQDTEELVDYAVKNLPDGKTVLDLCTGSGCVGISVLKNSSAAGGVLVDISPDAIAVAERNAKENGVIERTQLICSDIFDLRLSPDTRFHAILSNPPYVSESAYRSLEAEIYNEPKIAFLGGEDGGDFYRRIIPQFGKHLAHDGFFAFEIGFDQGKLLRDLASEYGYSANIIKDLCGNDRVAVLTRI